jgi:predicted Zn-dependent peptidase
LKSIAIWAALLLGPPDGADPSAKAPAETPAETSDAETKAEPEAAPEADAKAESAPAAPAFETFERDPIGVKQVVLDNGLTVLLSENHERPEVFGAVAVRTGGKNDPADDTGMAHYLEHMLFKGTTSLGTTDWAKEKPLMDEVVRLYDELRAAKTDEQRAKLQKQIGATVHETYAYAVPNELDKILGELGGTGVNAFTTEDETVYHNTFPASQIEGWLSVYAHRFQNPVFRLFPTELEAVYEEKNISMDRFEVKLFEEFIEHAYPEHPYGTQQVIGEVEHLKRPSLTAMREYYERYYVPNNMALVLAGDFDAAVILPAIEREFGALKRGPDPKPRTGKVEPFDGREQFGVRITPVRVGAFGFRTVPTGHPDSAALMVIRELLYNEQSSGLLDRLVEDGDLLIVFPFPQDLSDHALELIFYAPKIIGQSFRRAEKLVLEQFEKIESGQFDEAQMQAVRNSLRLQQTVAFEDNEERALTMANAFVRRLSWQAYADHLAQLQDLTKADVMRVAGEYFEDDYLVMRSRMGFPKKTRLQKPNYPSVEPRREGTSEFYRQHASRDRPKPRIAFVDFEADVQSAPVQPGVLVRRNENPLNEVYTLQLRFGAGTDAIPELRIAADYLMRLGTDRLEPEQLKRELFLLNTTLYIEATPERMVLELQGPEDQLPKALALVDGLMQRPRPDKKRLRQLRRELWGMQRVSRRDPGYVAGAAREFAFYGPNSAFLRGFGPRKLRRLDTEEVLAAWTKAQGYETEVRYVGRREAKDVAEAVKTALHFQPSLNPAVEKVVYPRVMPKQNTVFFLPRRDAIQTHLWFGIDGEDLPAESRAAAIAYDEFIGGGMAGLVFQEVREFRALAYSAGARFVRDPTPKQAAHLQGYVGCQADKTFEAIDVMLELITQMPQRPERVDMVKSGLLYSAETFSPDFRSLQGRIEDWRWSGYQRDPRRDLMPAVSKLQFADLERIYADQLADKPLTLVVVGDPRKVDRKSLEKYGKVVKLSASDVFPK